MVLMIDTLLLGTVNLGVKLFPYFMGNFDYPPPSNDVRMKDEIFQVLSFKMSYFHDSWNLPYPSTSMEWVGYLGMSIPLSIVEVTYNVVQQASSNPDRETPHKLYLVIEPIWA